MTHKVHPKAYRIKRMNDWNSRGFYKNHQEYLKEDFKIREFLRKKLGKIGIEKIEIERFPNKLNIIISSARPGLIIGRGGEGIEKLKKELEKKLGIAPVKKDSKGKPLTLPEGKPRGEKQIKIEIREIKNPWISANLSAQWAARQIEKRVPYRRVLKQTLSKISASKEAKGVRVELSGRLNGAEIARREWVKTGRLPLQTLRADVDYALVKAYCSYGVIGVKVWIYKGEKFE